MHHYVLYSPSNLTAVPQPGLSGFSGTPGTPVVSQPSSGDPAQDDDIQRLERRRQELQNELNRIRNTRG